MYTNVHIILPNATLKPQYIHMVVLSLKYTKVLELMYSNY